MLNNVQIPGTFFFRFLKRLFDIVLSLFLILPVIIIMIISGIVIKMEDNGSIFYIAERIGRFGKPFKMFKLRTMKENSPDIRLPDGSTYNSNDDKRLTKFGKIARKFSIDELPQIFNVIIGDMSFVGPRPDTIRGVENYTQEEQKILLVRPGITGYNQAINRNSVLTQEKLKNDIFYINNFSLWLDTKIFFMTIIAVLKQKNINRG